MNQVTVKVFVPFRLPSPEREKKPKISEAADNLFYPYFRGVVQSGAHRCSTKKNVRPVAMGVGRATGGRTTRENAADYIIYTVAATSG